VGTSGVDYLFGTSAANKINGMAGNDWIDGKWGDDTLTGGGGYDTFALNPGQGHDTVTDFGAGDHVYLKSFGGKVPTISQVGSDTLIKFSTGESITLKNVQSGTLSHSSDWAWINGTVNQSTSPTSPSAPPSGGTGIVKTGGSGYDAMIGGSGNDTLNAAGGNDWIEGKGGADTLTGGSGYDQFAFGVGSGRDTVTDFDTNMDKLYVKGHVAAGHTPTITQSGADALVTFTSTDSVLLKNVDMHSLSHTSDWAYIF
jgi:Ca2+-binding RTX toxin-like protein